MALEPSFAEKMNQQLNSLIAPAQAGDYGLQGQAAVATMEKAKQQEEKGKEWTGILEETFADSKGKAGFGLGGAPLKGYMTRQQNLIDIQNLNSQALMSLANLAQQREDNERKAREDAEKAAADEEAARQKVLDDLEAKWSSAIDQNNPQQAHYYSEKIRELTGQPPEALTRAQAYDPELVSIFNKNLDGFLKTNYKNVAGLKKPVVDNAFGKTGVAENEYKTLRGNLITVLGMQGKGVQSQNAALADIGFPTAADARNMTNAQFKATLKEISDYLSENSGLIVGGGQVAQQGGAASGGNNQWQSLTENPIVNALLESNVLGDSLWTLLPFIPNLTNARRLANGMGQSGMFDWATGADKEKKREQAAEDAIIATIQERIRQANETNNSALAKQWQDKLTGILGQQRADALVEAGNYGQANTDIIKGGVGTIADVGILGIVGGAGGGMKAPPKSASLGKKMLTRGAQAAPWGAAQGFSRSSGDVASEESAAATALGGGLSFGIGALGGALEHALSKKLQSGDFGPQHKLKNEGDPNEAINVLMKKKDGEVIGAYKHPDLGDIDFVYGKGGKNGYGLAHIAEKHGDEALRNIPKTLRDGALVEKTDTWAIIVDNKNKAAIRLDWNGKAKQWLVSAYEMDVPIPSGSNNVATAAKGFSAGFSQNGTPAKNDIIPQPNTASKKLQTSAVKDLVAQYDTVPAPISRQTRPLETFGNLANKQGLVSPEDVGRTANEVGGVDGLVSKAIRNAAGGAGEIDVNLDRDTLLRGVASSKKKTILQFVVDAIDETRSDIGGKKHGADTLDLIRKLETYKNTDLLGQGRNHLVTSQDEANARGLQIVIDNLRSSLDEAAQKSGSLNRQLTPQLEQELIAVNPGNAKWASYVRDVIMQSKNVSQLRSSIADLTKADIFIKAGENNAATFGGRAGNINVPTTEGGVKKGLINMLFNSPASRKAQYKVKNAIADKMSGAQSKTNPAGFAKKAAVKSMPVWDALTRKTTPKAAAQLGGMGANKALPSAQDEVR